MNFLKTIQGGCLWEECQRVSLGILCERHEHLEETLLGTLVEKEKQCRTLIKEILDHLLDGYTNIDFNKEYLDPLPPTPDGRSYQDYILGHCEFNEIDMVSINVETLGPRSEQGTPRGGCVNIYFPSFLIVVTSPSWVYYESASEIIRTPTLEAFKKGHLKQLGIGGYTDPAQLKKSYHKRALEVHPDKGGSAESFKQLKESYEILLQDPLEWKLPKRIHKKRLYSLNRKLLKLNYPTVLTQEFINWSIVNDILFPLHRELNCIKNISS